MGMKEILKNWACSCLPIYRKLNAVQQETIAINESVKNWKSVLDTVH